MPKIIVISTEEDCLFLIEKLLKNESNETICALTFEEGLDKIKEEGPDLVIIDCETFCNAGLENLDKIRSIFNGYIIVWALKFFIQKYKHLADKKTIFVNKLSENLAQKVNEILDKKMLTTQAF